MTVKGWRRLAALLFTVGCITAIELAVKGGISTNAQVALAVALPAYFGFDAWKKRGDSNG